MAKLFFFLVVCATTVFCEDWMQEFVDHMNHYRARHGSPPLKLNKDLTAGAQEWSEKNAKECHTVHRGMDEGLYNGQQTGENLWSGGSDPDKAKTARSAADSWYSEIKDYPFPEGYQGNDEKLFEKIGHFTQTVWKSSEEVGIGIAYNMDCPSGYASTYVTARFYPPGNAAVAGEEAEFYHKNVLPPQDK